jgi:phosphoribosyl-ATP pyrophosphohydrolase/phosphoribosyl-AMP cyclohydrolase
MGETTIQNIKFDERGIIPAVMQDASTGEVIALRFLHRDALARSLETGKVDILEGAGGGNLSYPLLDLRVNEDGKSLTIRIGRGDEGAAEARPSVLRESPGAMRQSPGGVSLVDVGSMEFGVTVGELYALISERNETRPEGSYTTYLFNSGLDKILKKIAEESGEVIIAAKNNSERELISELADVVYHLLVLMVERSVKVGEVAAELTRRAAKRSVTPEPR